MPAKNIYYTDVCPQLLETKIIVEAYVCGPVG